MVRARPSGPRRRAIRSCGDARLHALRRSNRWTPRRSPTPCWRSPSTARRPPTFEQAGLRYFVNAFWTAGQRRGHSMHEISYRACFKSQLPAFFIERLTEPGERVFDPFSGRGTTAVQAALMGRAPAANDVNPLSAMLSGPRLDPPSIAAVRAPAGRDRPVHGRRMIRTRPTCWRSTIPTRCARSGPCGLGC